MTEKINRRQASTNFSAGGYGFHRSHGGTRRILAPMIRW